jgi:hypothetical protein
LVAALAVALFRATRAAYTSKNSPVVLSAMSSMASRYDRSSSSDCTVCSRRSHAVTLGRRIPCRRPIENGVDDHVSKSCSPVTRSLERDDETNRSPPVSGSFCVSCMVSDALVCCSGRNAVLPSGCSTEMIERL